MFLAFITLVLANVLFTFVSCQKHPECMIYNDNNRNYMYAVKKYLELPSSNRKIGLWVLYGNRLDETTGEKSEVYFVENDSSGIWIFESVTQNRNENRSESQSSNNQTFYIRNKKFRDEYLMASKADKAVYAQKRKKPDDKSDESFMWKFDRLSSEENSFEIWNVKFGQQLFARRNFFGIFSLKVVNLGVRNPETAGFSSFAWLIRCRNNSGIFS